MMGGGLACFFGIHIYIHKILKAFSRFALKKLYYPAQLHSYDAKYPCTEHRIQNFSSLSRESNIARETENSRCKFFSDVLMVFGDVQKRLELSV